MDDRATHLIQTLDLLEHPEGGYYREVFRSPLTVHPADARAGRSSLTSIYFLLVAGIHSSWHAVRSDEAWHHYEGDPLELSVLEPESFALTRVHLGPLVDAQQPVHIVPAGHWQAARTLGAFTLVGCSVGPGFEFSDFGMMRDDKPAGGPGAPAEEEAQGRDGEHCVRRPEE